MRTSRRQTTSTTSTMTRTPNTREVAQHCEQCTAERVVLSFTFDVISHAPRGSSSESRHVIHVHVRLLLEFTSLTLYFDLSFTIVSLFFPLLHFEQHTELDNLIVMQNLRTSANKGVTTSTTSPPPSQNTWI